MHILNAFLVIDELTGGGNDRFCTVIMVSLLLDHNGGTTL